MNTPSLQRCTPLLAGPAVAVAVSCLLWAGCGKPSDNKGAGGVAANNAELATKKADQLWFESCQVCHGPTGKGDGEGARNLSPKPRAMDDPQWQAKITDPQIKRVIVKGGAAVGLSKSMPPTPSLASDKATLDALVAKIRGLKRAPKGKK